MKSNRPHKQNLNNKSIRIRLICFLEFFFFGCEFCFSIEASTSSPRSLPSPPLLSQSEVFEKIPLGPIESFYATTVFFTLLIILCYDRIHSWFAVALFEYQKKKT
ncbi:apical endosomal glycoprotein precursor [Sarcoptes scabiei]|nr:apical endosomal glycoprotein precursor [Sarcoptes scabiei]